jgi:hypothetical protein
MGFEARDSSGWWRRSGRTGVVWHNFGISDLHLQVAKGMDEP